MKADAYKLSIKQKAQELGFFHCGFSMSGFLKEEAPKLEQWLKEGRHGKMHYMENHFDERLDPSKLVVGSKSVISLLLNYFPEASQREGVPKISKYAYGEDYHTVIKSKLKALFQWMKDEIGDIEGRVFVDSAPVMDKAWARKSGLGWIGKNTNLINPKEGSFFFIAELITNLEFTADGPIKDYCGTCTKCIDACPTEALSAPYQIDAKKCISYLTIELKDQMLPNEFQGKMDSWAFGCDICQDVCPWNRFSKVHQEERFKPAFEWLDMNATDWEDLSREVYGELFKNSAIKRTRYEGLVRNLSFLKK